MQEFHIGFTGTREGMTESQKQQLLLEITKVLQTKPIFAHHGVCKGADGEFHEICLQLYVLIYGHPSNLPNTQAKCENFYVLLPAKDPLERNKDIIDPSSIVFVCPKSEKEEFRGSGTWAAYRYAKKLNKKIVVIYPDGNIQYINK
jgi:hypothetical protein